MDLDPAQGSLPDSGGVRESRDSLARFWLLARHSRDILLFMRRDDGRLLEVNQAAVAAYGYSRDELLALTIHDLRAPGTRGQATEQTAKADAHGLLFETWHVRKDGTTFPVEVSSRGASIEGTATLISVVRDISQRRQAEDALRLSEEKFAKIFESNPTAICLTRLADSRIVDANPAFSELSGYSRPEFFGRTILELKMWPSIEDRDRFIEDLRRDGSLRHRHQAIRIKSGELREFLASAETLTIEGEALMLSTWLDITERRRAEEELAAAGRAKDQFIAQLSHELRTPLTPAVAAMALLRTDARLPADVRRTLAMVSRNLDLEVRLIADLLDVSRVVSGKLHVEKLPVDVATAIREAAAIVDADLEDREQTLAIETPSAPYFTMGDTARLQQVFWNLLRNAIKFSADRGHIVIRARVAPVERCPLDADPCSLGIESCPLPAPSPAGDGRRGGNLVVEVIDEGSGIDPQTLPRLFNAFEQDEKARGSGGLGLGLSICRAIVEMHGGTIAAHSEGPGRGATFTVRLPLAQCALAGGAERPRRAEAAGAVEPAPARRRPLRVLLVEDHADTAEMMALLLGTMGHEAVMAGTVAGGLAAAERGRLDLLISDLGLPDGSGLDLIGQLATRGLRIPAIALSGYGTPADIRKSVAAGFAEHLVKPLDGAGPLEAAIARLGLLERRRG